LVFDQGGLVANAPHLPVHLGAMQEAVRYQIQHYLGWKEGEVLVSNSPIAGGSHLPDMTVITPCYGELPDGSGRAPIFYVASRGHHADIGGISPGSMPPFSKQLADEGAAIDTLVLVTPDNTGSGTFREEAVSEVLVEAGTRNLHDNLSDLRAQVASNQRGITLVGDLVEEYSVEHVQAYMTHIQHNAELAVRELLCDVARAHGTVLEATDFMDDGSQICLKVTLDGVDSPRYGAPTQVPCPLPVLCFARSR
jgi:5-oxoprolinase (ATP-hydrolysing)